MKFSNYFLIEANKKEKSSIEEDSNFILGAELEFCMEDMTDTDDIADFIKSKTSIKFNYSDDLSISVDNEDEDDEAKDSSIEIQTIPKPWKEFQEDVQVFLGLIQMYGYTNNSCGFHVTINYKDNELTSDFGDKLSSSMQDQKAHKYFPSRKDNRFAKSRTLNYNTNYNDKYYNFRIREKTNQVEFRIIGGKDYEYKWPEIRNLILDYMVKYKKSLLDPEFMKRKLLLSKKSPKYLYNYAIDVIKDRIPEAEPHIAKDPECAYNYAVFLIKDRFPEAEPYIAKDPKYAYMYARDIIKGSFHKAERFIATDPEYAYYYAKYIIKGRFYEGESYIAKNPRYAYLYTMNVIKGRFHEAEPYILKDPEYSNYYKKYVLNNEEKQ